MFRKSMLVLALAGTLGLVGCGGGGGGSDSGSGGGSGGGGSSPGGPPASTPTPRSNVAGPLDTVQQPVSSMVIAPLAGAAAGTPLAAFVGCVDQVVVGDALDIVDTLAAQGTAGATNFAASAAAVQAELTDLVSDLQGLLTSLAGGPGCSGTTTTPVGGANPLAGTPLESFGAILQSTLVQVQGQLTLLSGGSSAPNLTTLAGLFDQVVAGYMLAASSIPPEVTAAPVVGPALGLVGQALVDLDATVTAAASADAGATAAALTATLENLLTGLLTDVLPITMLESQAGALGALSNPIQSGIDQLTAAFAGGLAVPDGGLGGDLLAPLTNLLAPLLDPASVSDPTSILSDLLAQFTGAIGGGATGGAVTPLTGSLQIDTALASLTNLLDGAGTAGSPLAGLLGTLTGLLGGLLGGGGST